jgi:hypothetical protein
MFKEDNECRRCPSSTLGYPLVKDVYNNTYHKACFEYEELNLSALERIEKEKNNA